jgi:hypothetical protein
VLLSGKTRYVPEAAHVRIHQIWMGDRADDARTSSYSAEDMMIVERDIGRLAKSTFDMGGAGDLLSLSLSVAAMGSAASEIDQDGRSRRSNRRRCDGSSGSALRPGRTHKLR